MARIFSESCSTVRPSSSRSETLDRTGGEVHALKLGQNAIELAPVSQITGIPERLGHMGVDHLLHHAVDGAAQVLAVEHLLALLIDDLTLRVHHVVVFQDVFPHLEVAALDGLLGIFNGAGEDLRVDRRILVQAASSP